METKYYYVYIAANKISTVFYTGMTNILVRRIYEHQQKSVTGFTAKYNINRLVWFEIYEDINEAIKKEKQIKGGSRNKKMELIKTMNPEFRNLYEKII